MKILLAEKKRGSSPLWSATLTWWWGLAPMTRKISKIWRRGATKSWPNLCRQIATRLLTALQPSIYVLTAVTALWPLPVTFWLHSGMRIGPSWYGLSAGQV